METQNKQQTSINLNHLNYSTKLFEKVVIQDYLDSEEIMPLVEYKLENDGVFKIWESKYANRQFNIDEIKNKIVDLIITRCQE